MALSYTDPHWDSLEHPLEAELHLPSGGMKALRTRGERSNSDQVSDKGARTVYQIIPSTRNLVLKKYGVDAYADDKSAARAAALVAKEGLDRTGSWVGAVRQYHGGTDPKNYGPENRSYVERVTGTNREASVAGAGYDEPGPATVPKDYIGADWLNSTPGDLKFHDPAHINTHTGPQDKKAALAEMAQGQDVLNINGNDHSVGFEDVDKAEAGQVKEQSRIDAITPGQRLGAAFSDNTLTAAMWRRLNEQAPKADPHYAQYRDKHLDDILSFAKDADEEDWLLEANSAEEQKAIEGRIEDRRARRDLYQGSGVSTYGSVAYGLAGGILDPVGWAAGAGFGKLAEIAGIGGRTLIQAGKVGRGIASLAAENAATNVALTAALDATGDHYSSRDYASAAALGATFGVALSPFSIIGRDRPDTSVVDHFGEQAVNAQAEKVGALNTAADRQGPNATEDSIAREGAESLHRDDTDTVNTNLAPVPDNQMLLNGENLITADEGLKTDTVNKHGLDIINDDTSRNMAAEMIARSERELRRVKPQEYHTILERTKGESTATAMLNDPSPVLKNAAMQLLENPTGAGGRRRTASLSGHFREKLYLEEIRGLDQDFAKFRESRGQSAVGDFVHQDALREFNDRVFAERERRVATPDGTQFDQDPWVNRAADRLDRGYELMRRDQVDAKTIGSQNLPEYSRGYQQHQMDGEEMVNLHRTDRPTFNHIRDEVYVKQLMENNGFDRKFAVRLASRMLEEATNRAAKGYDVPLHLRSADASDLLEDALNSMKDLTEAQKNSARDKYYRGGAAHTKSRLKLDLNESLPNGKKLSDYYKRDVLGLYRGYARRVSGEVALAQYGILGRKGLEEMRNAAFRSGATEHGLRALDQISAEFLNTPFGKHNHVYLDNARLLASVSRLGGMGFTQMAEYGNGLAALGVHRILSSIGEAPRLIGEVHALLKGEDTKNGILPTIEVHTGPIGTDMYDMQRLFDKPDSDITPFRSEQVGIVTRGLRAASHIHATLSAHRIIHAIQVRGLSEQIIRKAVKYIRNGGMDKHLEDMGIHPELRARFAANMDKIATFKGKRLDKLDLDAGDLTPHEKAEFAQTVVRGSGQIIQRTFIGETGPWAHDGLLKLLLQFRTFGVTSIEKQWGRSMVRNGRGWGAAVRSFATLVGASSLVVPIYLARVRLAMLGMPQSEREDYWNKRVNSVQMGRATLQYTSMAGLAPDLFDGANSFASGSLGMDYGQQVGARGQYSAKLSVGTLVPTIGMADDLLSGATSLRKKDGSLNTHSVEKVGRLMPGSTLPFMQPLWNAVPSDQHTN